MHPNVRRVHLVTCQSYGFSFSFESEGSKLIIAEFKVRGPCAFGKNDLRYGGHGMAAAAEVACEKAALLHVGVNMATSTC